ncbi:hypothetical protein [Desulfonatronum thioautotrophicum]|uniref:hypothetical protein n=1 Tax=Desulfonatronum thioautotrophicum TaxID=617001 RepID=UPI0005EAE5E6|nr:hypothetical protein [Desulfonatronum thioautotrophicum]
MIKKIVSASIFFLLILISNPAFCLSEHDVERILDSMRELKTQIDEVETKLPDLDREDSDFSLVGIQKSLMETFAESHELSTVVTHKGYSSVDQWAEEGARIIRAMMAITVDEAVAKTPDFKAKVRADPNMTPEAAETIVRSMKDFNQEFQALFSDVPQADIEVVRPFISQLDEVF